MFLAGLFPKEDKSCKKQDLTLLGEELLEDLLPDPLRGCAPSAHDLQRAIADVDFPHAGLGTCRHHGDGGGADAEFLQRFARDPLDVLLFHSDLE